MTTKIEWAQETWNPITGCTPVSEGCANCYAKRMATRLRGRCGYPADDPFRVTFHLERLGQPAKWEKPKMIFVCSMGDLFHGYLPIASICQVLGAAKESPQHKYLFLTKRPDRMKAAMSFFCSGDKVPENWWLGVTAENQQRADERIPILLQIPAAVRFVSVEPMLSGIDLSEYIGYNPDYENKTQRKRSLPGHRTWIDGNRRAGQDMENSGTAREPLERTEDLARCHEKAGGTRSGAVPSSPTHGGPKQAAMPSPSSGLASLQWSDSRKFNREPHQRQKERQPAGELGTCNAFGTTPPCVSNGAQGSERPEKPGIKVDGWPDGGHPQDVSGRRHDTGGTGEAISCVTTNHIKNSAGGTSRETEWANIRLHEQASAHLTAKKCERPISLIIVGGETGPGARPMKSEWARSLRDQCAKAGVPFFFKKHGDWWCKRGLSKPSYKENRELDGREWNEMPNSGKGAAV